MRAAEILGYTYPDWGKASIDRFSSMLDAAFLSQVRDAQSTGTNGNWEAVMIETLLSIAVFEDDQDLFDKGIGYYKLLLPAYIYLSSDGPLPAPLDSAYFSTPAKLIAHWYG